MTQRVIVAIFSSNLQARHVRWPAEAEKEAAKQWVEAQSIPGFRDGWWMVDGTLIPISEKPRYYGDAFYDRKGRYTISTQIVNTPNRQIIDYATSLNGSRHDTHCFAFTRLSKDHDQLLLEGEWCWSDVGYPLQTWLMIPYKRPANTVSKENRDFDYQLSRIRIRSEHAIGYLKGRFQLLKELRILITSPKDITYASCWIQACIVLHAFAIDSELATNETWLNDGIAMEHSSRALDDAQPETFTAQNDSNDVTLRAGKAFRETLKQRLTDSP